MAGLLCQAVLLLFVCLFSAVLGLCCCVGFDAARTSRGGSLAAERGL